MVGVGGGAAECGWRKRWVGKTAKTLKMIGSVNEMVGSP